MKTLRAKNLLPEFPRTPHLPHLPNLGEGDVVAGHADAVCVLTEDDVWVEEKVDGANVGVCLYQDHPVMRSRAKILRKGKIAKDGLHSQEQFPPLWNWFYDNRDKFETLNTLPPFSQDEPAAVYGEWLWMAHGVRYDLLPSFFIPFDVYVPHERRFLSPALTRFFLAECGFTPPPLLNHGHAGGYVALERLCRERSAFHSTEAREGVYVKVVRGAQVDRFKMVRQDFVRGRFWGGSAMVRNTLRRDPVPKAP